MSTEIKVPTLGESVTTATVARWMKQPGEAVAADEPLVELETDKVTVEVTAPAAGVLSSIVVAEGVEVEVGSVLGLLEDGGSAVAAAPRAAPAPAAPPRLLLPRPSPRRSPPPIVPPVSIRRRARWARCRVPPPALRTRRCRRRRS